MKPLTYLLVDFENLQPPVEEIALVRGEDRRLLIFHGPHQNKFSAEMVMAWQPLGEHAEFVQSSRSGKNALDLHIAFCLGQLLTTHDPRFGIQAGARGHMFGTPIQWSTDVAP